MPIRKFRESWWVDISWRGERHRFRSPLNTRAGAHDFEHAIRSTIARTGSWPRALETLKQTQAEQDPSYRFDAFARRWFTDYVMVNNRPSEQVSKKNIIEARLIPHFGELYLNQITGDTLEHYKKVRLDAGIKPKTINNELSCLRVCLRAACESGALASPPRFRLLKCQRPPFRYLSVSDARSLVNSLAPGVLRAMVVTGLQTGLRYGELIGLHWTDVDWEAKVLTVSRSTVNGVTGSTKTFTTRTVPLTTAVIVELGYLPKNGDLIFADADGKPWKHPAAYKRLIQACVLAGVPVVGWHALRHTFASHLVSLGAPIVAVKDLLGHATIEMTNRYSHMNRKDLRQAVALLERRDVASAA